MLEGCKEGILILGGPGKHPTFTVHGLPSEWFKNVSGGAMIYSAGLTGSYTNGKQ